MFRTKFLKISYAHTRSINSTKKLIFGKFYIAGIFGKIMGNETFERINDEAYLNGDRYDLVIIKYKSYLILDPDNVYAVLNVTPDFVYGVKVTSPSKLEKILNKYFESFD